MDTKAILHSMEKLRCITYFCLTIVFSQGWKSGVKDNKPKKRKHLAAEPEKTRRNKKSAIHKETRKVYKDTTYVPAAAALAATGLSSQPL
jgi:hypothetical protein